MKYSIVIPTFQHLDDLLKPCINSIIEYTDLTQVQVIIVANGCTDGTVEYLATLKQPFNSLIFEKPLGYTRAANEGIKSATGEFVVVLNNDTVLMSQPKNKWLDLMAEPFADPKVGITGPLMSYSPSCERHFLIFFCAMIRASLFEEIGYFDEIFGVGAGEDTDFCIKAENKGYKILQVPDMGQLKQGEGTNLMIGNFPIWHKAEGTVHDELLVQGWSENLKKNEAILRERYMNKSVKLNLGCGGQLVDGYINIDLTDPRADVLHDATKINEIYSPGSVDEIMAIHLLEHISPYRVGETLTMWHGLLKKDGKLVLELPDVEKLCNAFATADKAMRYGILNCIYGAVNTGVDTAEGIITAPHLWGWYPEILWDHVFGVGFGDIEFLPEEYPHPLFNFRVVAYKREEAKVATPKKVGIIIPCYNSAKTLPLTLASIQAQTFTDWVAVVVNDGSMDNTWEVLNSITPNDDRFVRLCHFENFGLSAARNSAIEHLLKDPSITHIAFCDADDRWMPNHLMDVATEADMSYSVPDLVTPNGAKMFAVGFDPTTEATPENLAKGNFIFVSTVILKRETVKKVGMFDTNLTTIQDWDYWRRVTDAGFTIKRIGGHSCNYVVNDNSLASQGTVEELQVARAKHDLPGGWFFEDDIKCYRELYESLPDNAVTVEIGTWKGRSLCSVADIIKRKNIKVWGIDSFKGSAHDPEMVKQATSDDIQNELYQSLKKFGIFTNVSVLRGMSDEFHGGFNDGIFDMVFIDGDHSYESVMSDILNWYPKVKDGGIIAGHDFHWESVAKAINATIGDVEHGEAVWYKTK
jgi:glycosyltransferase involved in cell wall biosynthesis